MNQPNQTVGRNHDRSPGHSGPRRERPRPYYLRRLIAGTMLGVAAGAPMTFAWAAPAVELSAGFQPTSTLSGFATPGDTVGVFAYSELTIFEPGGLFQVVRNEDIDSTFGVDDPEEFTTEEIDPVNFDPPPQRYTPLVGRDDLLVNGLPAGGYFVASGTLDIGNPNSSFAIASFGGTGPCGGFFAGQGPRGSAWGGAAPAYDPPVAPGTHIASAGICGGSDSSGNPAPMVIIRDPDGVAEVSFTNELRDSSGASQLLWSVTLGFGTALTPDGVLIDVESADFLQWFDPALGPTPSAIISDEELEQLLAQYLLVSLTAEGGLTALLQPPGGADRLDLLFQFSTSEPLELVERFQAVGASPVPVPPALALFLSGFAALAIRLRRPARVSG